MSRFLLVKVAIQTTKNCLEASTRRSSWRASSTHLQTGSIQSGGTLYKTSSHLIARTSSVSRVVAPMTWGLRWKSSVYRQNDTGRHKFYFFYTVKRKNDTHIAMNLSFPRLMEIPILPVSPVVYMCGVDFSWAVNNNTPNPISLETLVARKIKEWTTNLV